MVLFEFESGPEASARGGGIESLLGHGIRLRGSVLNGAAINKLFMVRLFSSTLNVRGIAVVSTCSCRNERSLQMRSDFPCL